MSRASALPSLRATPAAGSSASVSEITLMGSADRGGTCRGPAAAAAGCARGLRGRRFPEKVVGLPAPQDPPGGVVERDTISTPPLDPAKDTMTSSLLTDLRERVIDESEPLPGLLRKCLMLGAES